MRPILSRQKPQFPVESTVEPSTGLHQEKPGAHVFAELRRLRQRVINLEAETGQNRRDIARIEQKLRRDGLKEASLPQPQTQEFSSLLFGEG
jgi:hypothetical protein